MAFLQLLSFGMLVITITYIGFSWNARIVMKKHEKSLTEKGLVQTGNLVYHGMTFKKNRRGVNGTFGVVPRCKSNICMELTT